MYNCLVSTSSVSRCYRLDKRGNGEKRSEAKILNEIRVVLPKK